MTEGQILFYGGIAGTAVFAVLVVIVWSIFEKKKKQLLKKIEDEL